MKNRNNNNINDIENWKNALLYRFKMTEADAMTLLTENKYTIDDVRRQRQISNYIQSVVRHCKDAELVIVLQQLNWIWNHLNSSLQRDVNRLMIFTTVLEFIQQLKKRQSAWKRYYVRELPRKPQQATSSLSQQSYYDQQYDNNNKGYNNQKYNRNQPSYSRSSLNNQRGGQNQQYDRNQQYGHDHNLQLRYQNSQSINQQNSPSSTNLQQRLIESPSSKQAIWQKSTWNAFAASSTPTYYNVVEKKYHEEKNHHKKTIEPQNQHHEKEFHRSVMTEVFFNNSNEFKYGLASYTC